jgi:hypothetical protein
LLIDIHSYFLEDRRLKIAFLRPLACDLYCARKDHQLLQSEQGQVVILTQVNSCVMLDSSFVTAKIEIFLLDHFTS